jgi:hypothetical protein
MQASHGVNTTVMAETVRQSLNSLDITRLPWCSDPPLYAMTAARVSVLIPLQHHCYILVGTNNRNDEKQRTCLVIQLKRTRIAVLTRSTHCFPVLFSVLFV